MAAPVLRRQTAVYFDRAVVQMSWLFAWNKIELALLIVSVGMMVTAVWLLLEMAFVPRR
jgi:hypothetical protein